MRYCGVWMIDMTLRNKSLLGGATSIPATGQGGEHVKLWIAEVASYRCSVYVLVKDSASRSSVVRGT
jgi:hypothetical protein